MSNNYDDDKIRIEIDKNINVINFNFYKNKLDTFIKKDKSIIFDLDNTEHIDCAGLDIIITLYHRLKENNSSLKIQNISSPYIEKFIELTNLNDIIEIL